MRERTFWGQFTREGRLHNLWAEARADPDPDRSLERLRKVRDRIAERPEAYVELWLDFLRSMLHPRLLWRLEDRDFRTLEAIGGQVVHLRGANAVGLVEVWYPLITARDARGEEDAALALLTRLYRSSLSGERERVEVAARLAQRGARGEDHLVVYADLLSRTQRPPADVVRLVVETLRVDFHSGGGRIRQAGDLASYLSRTGVRLPGLETAIGLRHLLVDGDPALAAVHLARASATDPRDEIAYAALLAARLRQGDHTAVTAGGGPASRRVAELTELGRTLAWLDDPTAEGYAPADAARLAGFAITAEAGEWLDYAIGRMALLAGDVPRAATLLVPLADAHPGRPQWSYHATWALLLRGDREGVARRFDRARDRTGGWTVGCLMLDADPGRDADGTVSRVIRTASGDYAELAEARIRLARAERVAAVRQPPPGNGTLAEDLEALRTVMGARAARHEHAALATMLRLPLFRRLPAAERLLWAGVAALPTDTRRGRALLTEAAQTHRRAALVLAAHELASGRSDAATGLIADSGPTMGPKQELLVAWALARRGDEEAAIERLDRIASWRMPRARHLRGVLLLRSAIARRSAEGVDLAAEAASELGGAAENDPSILALARAAQLLAGGTIRGAPAPRPSAPDHPWETWVLGLASITEDPTGVNLGVCESLVRLLDRTPRPPPPAVTALAAALTRACLLTDDGDRAKKLAELLGRIVSEDAAIRRWRDLATTAAYRHAPGEVPTPAPVPLALAATRRGVAGPLETAHPADETERMIRDIVLSALNGHPPPDLPADLPAAVRDPLLFARAMAVADADPRQCRDLVAKALPGLDMKAVTPLVDMDRALPVLTVAVGRARSRRSPLADVVAQITSSPDAEIDRLTLARCATAVGNHAIADELWRRILDGDEDVPETTRAEYVSFLCHEAQRFRGRGEPLRAAERLTLGAHILVEGSPASAPPPPVGSGQ